MEIASKAFKFIYASSTFEEASTSFNFIQTKKKTRYPTIKFLEILLLTPSLKANKLISGSNS